MSAALIKSSTSRPKFRWNVLFLLATFFLLTSCDNSKTIVYGLDQNEANEILVFLTSRGVQAEKAKSSDTGGGGGAKTVVWDIVVPAEAANEAMRLLNQQGLPRKRGQNVLGIFSTSGLVPSDLQEKIKYRAALAEQIASTIRKYDGVLDADVQISFPEEDPLNPGKMKGKITASVWVKHSGILDDPNSHLVTKIKRFVASSITGLNYDDVTVIGELSRIGSVFNESSSEREEEKSYVQVWSIVLAKESLTRFRIIFFTFCVALLLCGLALVWVLWKTIPLLHKHGGIRELFSLKSSGTSSTPPSDKNASTSSEKPATQKDEKPKKEQSNIDKDIDET